MTASTATIDCEMCYSQDAIGLSGAVPICDNCIVEFGVNPQEVKRSDGLSSEWVSPVEIAKKDQLAAALGDQLAAERLRVQLIAEWAQLPAAQQQVLMLGDLIAVPVEGLANSRIAIDNLKAQAAGDARG